MRCIECDAADVSERRERRTARKLPDASGAAPVVSSSMNAAVEFSNRAQYRHPTSSHSWSFGGFATS